MRALRERVRRAGRVAPRLRAGDADARRARLLPRQRRSHSAAGPGRDADAAASRHRAAHGARGAVRLRVRPSQPVLRPRAAARARTRRGCRSSSGCSSRPWPRPKPRASLPVASASCATTATGRTRSTRRPAAAGGSAGRSSCPAAIRSCSIAAARSARRLIAWPAEHVVKCLVQFHPDDAIDIASRTRRRSARCTTPCRRAGTSCCSRSFRHASAQRPRTTTSTAR